MSEKLKPCPWPDCGKNEGTLDSVQTDVGELWAVTCPHCERSVEGKDGSRQGAIAAWNALPRTVPAAPSDDTPADPYSGELGAINLRLIARKMLLVLRYLKRQGVYHPAMDDLIGEGIMHGLELDGPIPDPDRPQQAAPSEDLSQKLKLTEEELDEVQGKLDDFEEFSSACLALVLRHVGEAELEEDDFVSITDLEQAIMRHEAAPSDRETQYMEALAAYANDEDRYNRGDGEPYGSIPVEVGAIARQARAALADTTNNNDGG